MKKIISFLKTDVKIINSYFLFTIILIILVCIGYSSYALFSFTKTSNNIIEGTVGELSKSGTDTLIKLTDNKDNSGLYTITHAKDTTLQIGNDKDITEYRYRGASPKNYVTFNNEVWRIIGIFPTDDGTGKIENRIKLIRNESIGNIKWDESLNNWVVASLKTYLNDTYYKTFLENSKNLIGQAKYYLGGYGDTSGISNAETPVNFYNYERKIQNTQNNEFYYGNTRSNNWIGIIGLIYVSDYGYASINCETKWIRSSDNAENDLRSCNSTNWLYNYLSREWLIVPTSNTSSDVFSVSNGEIVSFKYNYSTPTVRPTLYLLSNVKITGGSGTSTDPYTLGL